MRELERHAAELGRMQIDILQRIERTSIMAERRAPIMMEYYLALMKAAQLAYELLKTSQEPLTPRGRESGGRGR